MSGFTQAMVLWLQSTFHNNSLVTVIISIIPMIECRGAITVATNLGMNVWAAFALSCVSSLIVCPILILFLKPILKALKKVKWFNKLAVSVESLFQDKANKINSDAVEKIKENPSLSEDALKKQKIWKKALGIFLFVAVPLPMTGVWTGTAVAVFLDLDYKYSIPAIVIGNFVAGFIITLLNIMLGDKSSIILLVLAIFVLITLISLFITLLIKRKKSKITTKE